jgi:hypothetical protein
LKIPRLDAVFERGLHRDPVQRFGRASAFVSALFEVLQPAEQSTGADQLPPAVEGSPALSVSGMAAVSGVVGRLSPFWTDRVVRKFAAGLVAAAFIVSVYG